MTRTRQGQRRRGLPAVLATGLLAVFFLLALPVVGDEGAGEVAAQANCERVPGAFHVPVPARAARGRFREELAQAHAWAALLDEGPRAARLRGGHFDAEAALDHVDRWLPLITCLSTEFGIPLALLAGLVATELYLDYHVIDALVDAQIRAGTPIGLLLSHLAIGGGYGGVHNTQLLPALRALGPDFSATPFYRAYYTWTSQRSLPELTRATTREISIDLANTALMARHYALLRLNGRPFASMTLKDMAFTWSAYRGGVANTPADAGPRVWGLRYLQEADDPYLLGDVILALPFFSHYQAALDTPGASSPPAE